MAGKKLASGYVLSEADIAKQQARKAAKAAEKLRKENGGDQDKPLKILKREWVDVAGRAGTTTSSSGEKRVKVSTWNMLAQTLVRKAVLLSLSICACPGIQTRHG